MKKKWILQVILLAIAGVFIFIGVNRGEAAIVLNKAIRVCLECVGLK